MSYEGYYSTTQTAKILELPPRQVRNLVFEGKMGASLGEDGHLHIPRRAVREHRQWRCSSSRSRMSIRELTDTVQDLRYRLGRAEARPEITQSSLCEDRYRMLADLERERGRADRAESEASELRRHLQAYRRPRCVSCSGSRCPQDAGRVRPLIEHYGCASSWKCRWAKMLYSRRSFWLRGNQTS